MKRIFNLLFFSLFFINAYTQISPALTMTVNGKAIETRPAAFGPVFEYGKAYCNEVVLIESVGGANPTNNSKAEGCDNVLNAAALKDKIALIRGGTCTSIVKVKNAQLAGAKAVIIYNNTPNTALTNLTGTDTTIKIPSCRISLEDGSKIIDDLSVNKPVQVCITSPIPLWDNAYGNRFVVNMPLSQADSINTLVSVINRGTEPIEDVQFFAEITAPSGTKETVSTDLLSIPPTTPGFVRLLPFNGYIPTEKGVHNIKMFGNFVKDTAKTQFIISDYTYANDNGVLTGTGTGRTPATFASQGKKYSHLNYYPMGSKGGKATYATFGIINAAQMKNRSFKISLWESSEEKLKAINNLVNDLELIAEFPVGDEYTYKMVGSEKSLITIPLKDGNKKYIDLEPDKIYVLAVEYNGISYTDSIVPQYTLAKTLPIRWPGFSVSGTAVMSGTNYFGGGWATTEDPVGRLHIDNFVGAEDLQQLEQDEVNIFPNPTTGMVNLKLDLKENHKKVELGIMNMMGRILNVYTLDTQNGIIPINISSYPAGTYFFTVKTDKAFTTEKVIKE